MDMKKWICDPEEKPLDRLVDAYSFTSIFRKIAFVGDSMSSGEFQVTDPDGKSRYYDMFDYSWGQYIARKNGQTAYNFSKGGMTAKEYMESFAESKGFWAADLACQAYVIALGANDLFWRDIPLGSMDDIDRDNFWNNKPTFAGYYAQIVSRYKEISPDAKFFFVGLPCLDEAPKQAIAEKMLALIKEMARYFGNAYVIDLYHYAPCYDETFKRLFFLSGHKNPMGYVLHAQLIDSYIDYIIRHNMDDFKTVGFINSGIRYKT